MQEIQVKSLGQEDPLEKGMATHSIPWPGEFHRQSILMSHSPWGRKESDMAERLTLSLCTAFPQFTAVSAYWSFLHVTLTSEVQFLPSWC